MTGESILHYRILEKLGSPREITVFKIVENDNYIISRGKPHEIQAENIIFDESCNVISRGKGGTL